MDEGRKRVLGIMASILVARHLKDLDGRLTPASETLIANAVRIGERILRKIDSLFRAHQESSSCKRNEAAKLDAK